jgi:hypothetical protein
MMSGIFIWRETGACWSWGYGDSARMFAGGRRLALWGPDAPWAAGTGNERSTAQNKAITLKCPAEGIAERLRHLISSTALLDVDRSTEHERKNRATTGRNP